MQAISSHATASMMSDTENEKRINAIKGAFFSEFVDLLDIYLPIVVLSPVLFYFHPANLSSDAEALLGSLVFITTLLGRPVGAVVFGALADRMGRRMASLWSVGGFAGVTLLIALLPGYDSIGIASYWLLILLRFVDGIFLGGGYTGAIPLALEYSRKQDRGFVGGLILAAFPAAYVAINLMAIAMFALFPLDGPASPYAQVGWRIPFVIGALLAGLLFLYYKFKVSESEVWQVKALGERQKQPLTSLLRGHGGRDMLQVLLLMTGFWTTQNIITIFVPTTLLRQFLHLSKFELTSTLMLSYSLLIFTYIGSGMIGQRIGRRLFFMIAAPLIGTVGATILYVLVAIDGLSLPAIITLVCLLSILVTSPWGVIVSYINERFATDVRATGFGAAYSLSVIIPSFYAFYMAWLGEVMPFRITPVLLLVIGAIVATVGAAMGPETRDVDL